MVIALALAFVNRTITDSLACRFSVQARSLPETCLCNGLSLPMSKLRAHTNVGVRGSMQINSCCKCFQIFMEPGWWLTSHEREWNNYKDYTCQHSSESWKRNFTWESSVFHIVELWQTNRDHVNFTVSCEYATLNGLIRRYCNPRFRHWHTT
jgi:hypothetical protein